jgi:glucokinase
MNEMQKSVGIDIGGTKSAVATVDDSGRIHSRTVFETGSKRGFKVGLAELAAAIRRVLDEAGWTIDSLAGIGIGCTGPVNPLRGTIHNPYTLPGWEDAQIVRDLTEIFHLAVRLENDADAAAVGEYQFGAGARSSPLVVVTLGTGVGGAVLLDGQIHRGVNGEHPELGHIPALPEGPECYCGSSGCWESIASGTAIGLAGKEAGFQDSREVFGAYPGDPKAAKILDRAVLSTVTATWTLLHTFLPEMILLGGGIGEAHFDLFAEPMRRKIQAATQISKNTVRVAKAKLGQDAGVIGAAALAFQAAKP